MNGGSPLALASDLGLQVKQLLAGIDIDALVAAERDLVAHIKRQASDMRLDVRDYEYAETRAEQLTLSRDAHKRLKGLESSIVEASKSNIFSAVDVATLSAHIEQLLAKLT